jgi:hypothetical protein
MISSKYVSIVTGVIFRYNNFNRFFYGILMFNYFHLDVPGLSFDYCKNSTRLCIFEFPEQTSVPVT